MESKTFRRKLTAVLSADVEGFSRLMDEDEAGTHKKLVEYRGIIETLCQIHHGRMVNTAGDGFLLEFASAVDALGCAVEMQREFDARNAGVPENRVMRFRVGINVGDVIEEEDQIFGDGVNIAARLQALAEGGGVCISGEAYDQVKKKLALPYDFLGKKRVKNISDPVRIYRVGFREAEIQLPPVTTTPSTATRRQWKWWFPAIPVALAIVGSVSWYFVYRHGPTSHSPDPPRDAIILVKEFHPVTGDKVEEELSKRIHDEAGYHLQNLSRITVTTDEKSEKKADYVFSGSVQKLGNEVKVKAYLDGKTSADKWQKEYRFPLEDKEEIPEETIAEIMNGLQARLAVPEERLRGEVDPAPAGAYLKFREGMEQMFSKRDLGAARKSFGDALRIKQDYASAYGGRAFSYLMEFRRNADESGSDRLLDNAFADADKAVKSNEKVDLGHIVLTHVHLQRGKHDLAIYHAEQAAREFGAVGVYSNVALATAYIYSGKPTSALKPLRKAAGNAKRVSGYLSFLRGEAFRGMKEYEKAVQEYRKAVQGSSRIAGPARVGLIVTYDAMGETGKAREVASELEKSLTRTPLNVILVRMPYKNSKEHDKITAALKRTGLISNN